MSHFDYRDHHLWVEELPVSTILEHVGTPCYLYSYQSIVDAYQQFSYALKKHPHQICYAVKANSNLAILKRLSELGAGFDIVSGGELNRVIRATQDARNVVFSGVGKTAEEISLALEHNIACLNVESQPELDLINQIATHKNCIAPIAFRINPNVASQSHPFISTGLAENKFGIEYSDALALYQKASHLSHVAIKGIACHIGSQITSLTPFANMMQRINELIELLTSQGIKLEHVDVGGGLGVNYSDQNPALPTIDQYIQTIVTNLAKPIKIIFEPGRALMAQAGLLVTKILYLKKASTKNFCIVDAGMNDFLRPALYGARHDIIPVEQKSHYLKTKYYDIVGPICESGDFFATQLPLAVESGDLLAIRSTGAYGFSLSSQYPSRPRPPEVLIDDKQFKIVRARESLDHLCFLETTW